MNKLFIHMHWFRLNWQPVCLTEYWTSTTEQMIEFKETNRNGETVKLHTNFTYCLSNFPFHTIAQNSLEDK